MSYLVMGGPPPFDLFQAGTSPGPWGGLPGPVLPVGPVGPTGPAAGLFPTTFKPGDVVMVSGNFAGLSQGQVRVKVEGAPWMSPMMQGPFTGSFIVPDGAQTGACQIEVNGQIVFGTQCVVSAPAGATFYGQRTRPREPVWGRAWKNYGDQGRLAGLGSCCAKCESHGSSCAGALGEFPGGKTGVLVALGLAYLLLS